MDDEQAKLTGDWQHSHASPVFVGQGYRHDRDKRDGKSTASFTTKIPETGRYEVLLSYPPHPNRSSKVAVEIQSDEGTKTLHIDQRKAPTAENSFHSLGLYKFQADKPGTVTISNTGSDGYVVIDAVQWLKK